MMVKIGTLYLDRSTVGILGPKLLDYVVEGKSFNFSLPQLPYL